MKNNKIIALDIDDVILDLMPQWLSKYNDDYGDKLSPKDIADWSIDLFVKPECGKKIYDYIKEPYVFLESKPIDGALAGVKWLKEKGFRVVFISASNPNGSKEKWLRENGFWETENDFYQAYDKSLIMANALLDDKPQNIQDFKYGQGYLFSRPWNLKFDYKNRINSWDEFLREISLRFMWDIL
jgi:5'(3')-deoxyribonucleotidase